MPRSEPMHIGLFLKATGHHLAAWHHPEADLSSVTSVEHFVASAQLAERHMIDFIFFADSLAIRGGPFDKISRFSQFTAHLEPLTLLSAIATQTEKIGLVCTMTTSYNDPYHVARKFASLDHISHGRAGWNVVTSGNPDEAPNFGREAHYGHAERYQRAREFVSVVQGLWDSWDDDAFIHDRAGGNFFDPDKLHRLDHQGEFFKVRGPLNLARPPQGHPVIFQAGTSEDGRDLSSAVADGLFTSELTVDKSKLFYDDLKARAARLGRDPDNIVILPGLTVIIGDTDDEAEAKDRYMQSLIPPDVGRDFLADLLGMDLSGCAIDEPLPDRPSSRAEGGVFKAITTMARDEGLTIEGLYKRLSSSFGKLVIKGSVKTVADEMERWYAAHACDGFILQPPVLPGDLEDICAKLIPELQRRGLARTSYRGSTLRDHLGLDHVPSRYVVAS